MRPKKLAMRAAVLALCGRECLRPIGHSGPCNLFARHSRPMPPGVMCTCGHDSSHHESGGQCWYRIAHPDECATCDGFTPAATPLNSSHAYAALVVIACLWLAWWLL